VLPPGPHRDIQPLGQADLVRPVREAPLTVTPLTDVLGVVRVVRLPHHMPTLVATDNVVAGRVGRGLHTGVLRHSRTARSPNAVSKMYRDCTFHTNRGLISR
jgi:hypothetical protein